MVKRGFLEPKSPAGPTQDQQKTRLKRFGALMRFERMGARTHRDEGVSSNELDEGDEWAILTTWIIRSNEAL